MQYGHDEVNSFEQDWSGTINFFGCGKDDYIRAYHRRDMREMCVAGRGPTLGILGERGRITSSADVRGDTAAVTCVKCVPRGCGDVL